MAPRYPYYKTANSKAIKHHLKHLADLKDPSAIKSSIKYAPEGVIKRICDCALNVLKGDVILTPNQRTTFKKHRRLINSLVQKGKSVKSKHQLLNQKGGSILLSILLPLVLSTFGSLIFGKK